MRIVCMYPGLTARLSASIIGSDRACDRGRPVTGVFSMNIVLEPPGALKGRPEIGTGGLDAGHVRESLEYTLVEADNRGAGVVEALRKRDLEGQDPSRVEIPRRCSRGARRFGSSGSSRPAGPAPERFAQPPACSSRGRSSAVPSGLSRRARVERSGDLSSIEATEADSTGRPCPATPRPCRRRPSRRFNLVEPWQAAQLETADAASAPPDQ